DLPPVGPRPAPAGRLRRARRPRRGRRAALAELTTDLRDTADRWPVAQGAVGAPAVVPAHPAREGAGALGAGGIGVAIRPLPQGGADEGLRLAVGARGVGTGAPALDAQPGAGIAPGMAAIGMAVVGQHALDPDAVLGAEPGRRAAKEGARV